MILIWKKKRRCVIMLYRFSSTSIWSWDNKRAPVTVRTDQALLLYSENKVYIDFERKRKVLNSKLLIYVQPESTVTIHPIEDQPAIVIGIYFQAYTLQEESQNQLIYKLDYSMLPNNGFVLKPISQRTPALVRALVQQSEQITPDSYICVKHLNELIQQIIMQMNRTHIDRDTSEQAVAETIQAMLMHCEKNWTREETARSKQFNSSHFSRAFQTVSSYSFSAMLSKIRVNRAKILLLSTSMTLDQIAHRVGFMNGLYLSRRFKQECGVPPTHYRLKIKEKTMRIVSMQQAGDLMALGITPVAASFAQWHTSPLLQHELMENGTVSIYELEDVDAIRKLNPDLILLPDYILTQNASRLRQLEQIAPVLFFSVFQTDTLTRLTLLSRIVEKEEEAHRWIEFYDAEATYWRQKLQQSIHPTESAACYEIRGDNEIIIWLSNCRSSYNFYHALQLQLPLIY